MIEGTFHRIVVVGASGSGKTMLAEELARRLGYCHIELDALHWQPNWTESPIDVFRERVTQALTGDTWTLDGNYSRVRDLIWECADTIVWLDYDLPIILWRLCWRSIKRIVTREKLWNGNYETWRSFFSRDSLILWVLQSQPRHRRDYPLLLQRPEYAHLKLIRLHSPCETTEWLIDFDAGIERDILEV